MHCNSAQLPAALLTAQSLVSLRLLLRQPALVLLLQSLCCWLLPSLLSWWLFRPRTP
jgi:hypothetical protein